MNIYINMNYLITENQLILLIKESEESKIENKIKSLNYFAKEVWDRSGLLRKLNLFMIIKLAFLN